MSVDLVLRVRIDGQPFSLPLAARPDLGLTPRELGRLKRLASGVAGTGIIEALQLLDGEVIAGLSIIAAERSGATIDADAILDGKATLEVDWENFASPPRAVGDATAATSLTTTTTPDRSGDPS